MTEPRPSDPRPASDSSDLSQPMTGLSSAFPFRRPPKVDRPGTPSRKPAGPVKHPPRGN